MYSTFFKSSLLVGCGLILCALNGCAVSEFDIVEPPEFHQHVGHGKEVIIKAAPLEYHLVAVEDRLVMQIFNESGATIRFLGDQSSEVDPDGQLHPLAGMTIPAGAHMKLILPPTAHLEPTGPHIGFGFGFAMTRGGYGPWWGDGLGYIEPVYYQPRYIAAYDAGDSPWGWPDDSNVRLLLTFQQSGDKPFTQEWVIRKRAVR